MNFYPPPETITASVHFEIPHSLRCVGESTDWTRAFHGDNFQHIFLEGPMVDREGNLFIVDVAFGRILKIDADGKNASCAAKWEGEPNGLALMHDGTAVVADYKNGILQFDPKDNSLKPWLARRNLERFKGPNDLIVDSKGNVYFTDQGQTGLTDPTGKVYRVSPEGRLDCLIENGPSPNGLVLSTDEKFLYVAMTRANQVWRMPLHKDGSVTKAGMFYQGMGNVGPDGLAVDTEGNVFVCDPGLGRIFVLSKRGVPYKIIKGPSDDDFLTNCTWGGPEGKTLFITSSFTGQVLKVDWHCAGKV